MTVFFAETADFLGADAALSAALGLATLGLLTLGLGVLIGFEGLSGVFI